MSSDYVLITPARNEEAGIGRTLESMVAQTHLPLRWVVVDDGSTDRTAEIVERYVKQLRLDRAALGCPFGSSERLPGR